MPPYTLTTIAGCRRLSSARHDLLRTDPDFAALMAGRPADGLVPTFITSHLPVGFRGLLVAAILGLLPLAALSIPGA